MVLTPVRQGCSENWVLPPAWVTSHGHDTCQVSRYWGTVLLVSDGTGRDSCPATAISSQWLKGQTLPAQSPQPCEGQELP